MTTMGRGRGIVSQHSKTVLGINVFGSAGLGIEGGLALVTSHALYSLTDTHPLNSNAAY